MKWERDATLDSERAYTEIGVFTLVRTAFDMSILRLNSVEVCRVSGGHNDNKILAANILAAVTRRSYE